MATLTARHILSLARASSFDLVALIPYTCAEDASLQRWLAEARHACLAYMPEHDRHDPRTLFPKTRYLLVTATSYHHHSAHSYGALKIARYAHKTDYHSVLRQRLNALAERISLDAGAAVSWRCVTDSAPLLERDLAARAGLGWIGKNTLLIHPTLGSFTLLAELLLDLPDLPDLDPPTLTPDRCGSCTRCMTACPTAAISAPRLLDARRCISTWTIESSGPIPRWIRPLIGDMLFGCDICQEVCPWNTKPPATEEAAFLPDDTAPFLTPADLLSMTSRQFNRTFKGSPLMRAGRKGLARNAAVVLGNKASPDHLDLLLARSALEHAPLVRGHVAWALSRYGAQGRVLTRLERMASQDPDEYVRLEASTAFSEAGERAP